MRLFNALEDKKATHLKTQAPCPSLSFCIASTFSTFQRRSFCSSALTAACSRSKFHLSLLPPIDSSVDILPEESVSGCARLQLTNELQLKKARKDTHFFCKGQRRGRRLKGGGESTEESGTCVCVCVVESVHFLLFSRGQIRCSPSALSCDDSLFFKSALLIPCRSPPPLFR